MNFRDIKKISRLLPAGRMPRHVAKEVCPESGISVPFDEEAGGVLRSYMRQDFAWQAAVRLLAADRPLPFFPRGRAVWVQKAWDHLRACQKGMSGSVNPDIGTAHAIDRHPGQEATRDALRASLIADGMTTDKTADFLGLRRGVVKAYEALFWNVTGRDEDTLYLRNLVYPYGRFEEMDENYSVNARHGKSLLRVAYNNGHEAMAYFAGFRTNYLDSVVDAGQAAGAFNRRVMVQGFVLANNGFLNHHKHPGAISAARALAQSQALGGVDNTDEDQGVGSMYDVVSRHLMAGRDKLDHDLRKQTGRL